MSPSRPSILFVDDEPNILSAIRRSILSVTDEWELVFAASGAEAIDLCAARPFDLIVTDARMPFMMGDALLKELSARGYTQDVPTIMLTGYAEEETKRRAIESGVIELLYKPIMPEELIQRIKNVLRLKAYSDELKRKNAELTEASRQLIRRLGKAAEYRDNETGKHVLRVGQYSRILAEGAGLAPEAVELIFLTAPMHDVGKIAIPDEILKKKDKLKPIEFDIIKTHALVGSDVLKPMNADELKMYYAHMEIGEELLGESDTPILKMAASIAVSHHERWDGTGYPHGLVGEAIPMEGRIVAVADVFDALSSKRYYKPAFPEDQCISIIRELSGTHLDPALVQAFNGKLEEILAVKRKMAEE